MGPWSLGGLEVALLTYLDPVMRDAAHGFPRRCLPRASVNRAKGGAEAASPRPLGTGVRLPGALLALEAVRLVGVLVLTGGTHRVLGSARQVLVEVDAVLRTWPAHQGVVVVVVVGAQAVVAPASTQLVCVASCRVGQKVGATSAVQPIIAVHASSGIVSCSSVGYVVSGVGHHEIVAVLGVDDVGSVSALDVVVLKCAVALGG